MTSLEERRKIYREQHNRDAQKYKQQVVWDGSAFVPVAPEPEPESSPNVTVKDADPEPEQTFVDKMRKKFAPGTATPEPTKTTSARGKPKPNLMLTVFPGMAATFLSTFLTDIYKDPYKPCAPTKDEAQLIVMPIFEYIGHAIKITGKIDPLTECMLNCAAMSALYGARAYQTYVQIKRAEKEKDDGRTTDKRARSDNTVLNGNIPTTNIGTVRPDNISTASTDAKGNSNDNDTNGEESDSQRTAREAALVHDMFKRDIEGRIRLGVLPARVGNENRNTD